MAQDSAECEVLKLNVARLGVENEDALGQEVQHAQPLLVLVDGLGPLAKVELGLLVKQLEIHAINYDLRRREKAKALVLQEEVLAGVADAEPYCCEEFELVVVPKQRELHKIEVCLSKGDHADKVHLSLVLRQVLSDHSSHNDHGGSGNELVAFD